MNREITDARFIVLIVIVNRVDGTEEDRLSTCQNCCQLRDQSNGSMSRKHGFAHPQMVKAIGLWKGFAASEPECVPCGRRFSGGRPAQARRGAICAATFFSRRGQTRRRGG